MLLIAAHCRSGTTYTHRLLRHLGLQIGHEIVETGGTVSGYHASCITDFPFKKIFHQVRHPLAVISSSQTLGPTTWARMREAVFVPDDPALPAFVWAAHSWVNWNLLIEKHAHWRYRVEDLDELWPELCARLDIVIAPPLPEVSKTINTRLHTDVTLADIACYGADLADRVADLGRRYGYAF